MDYSWIVMLVLMFALLYFFMIRPAVGDEITTIGGMTGTVCAVKENTIVFETGADRVRIEITKWAVSTKNGQSTQATR